MKFRFVRLTKSHLSFMTCRCTLFGVFDERGKMGVEAVYSSNDNLVTVLFVAFSIKNGGSINILKLPC